MPTVSLPVTEQIYSNLDNYLEKADDDAINTGLNWYISAHDYAVRLADNYKISLAQAAGIIARLSPAVRWTRNIIAAELLLEGKSGIDGYSSNIEKARQMAMGRFGRKHSDILATFPEATAPKIRNFYQNIYNPTDREPVTVDRWIIRAAYLKEEAKKLPNEMRLTNADYQLIADKIRELSICYKLLPNQAQAIIWEVIHSTWKNKN